MRTSVSKLPSGKWRARYYHAGRWIAGPATFKTKTAARDWLSSINVDVLGDNWIDPSKGAITVEEWAQVFWPLVEVRVTTKTLHKAHYENWIKPRWGHRPLNGITTLEVAEWIGELRATDRAPATIRAIYYVFRKMMEWAVEPGGKLSKNPCPKRPALPRVWPRRVTPLTVEEIEKLADAVGARWSTVVWLFSFSGMRISELAALRVDDFDFDAGTVMVDEKVVDPDGVLLYESFLKTDNGWRKIALPWEIMDRVAAHIATYVTDPKPTSLVFTGPQGGAMRPRGWPEYVLAPAVDALGLDGFSPHAFRHTAVSMWISMGASIKQVADRAGCNVATINRVYAHLFPGDEERLRKAMDSALRERAKLAPAVGGNVVPFRPRTR